MKISSNVWESWLFISVHTYLLFHYSLTWLGKLRKHKIKKYCVQSCCSYRLQGKTCAIPLTKHSISSFIPTNLEAKFHRVLIIHTVIDFSRNPRLNFSYHCVFVSDTLIAFVKMVFGVELSNCVYLSFSKNSIQSSGSWSRNEIRTWHSFATFPISKLEQ